MFRSLASLAVVASASSLSVAQLIDLTTYQGRLLDGAVAAQGEFDVTFSVYDTQAGGSPVASQIRVVTLAPADAGVFTVPDLNFTPALVTGSDLWLGVAIAPPNGSPVTLTPRQPLTATPRASYAGRSGTSLQDAYDNGRTIVARTNEPVSIEPGQRGDLVQLVVGGGGFDATPQILIGSPSGTTARLSAGNLLLPEVPGSPLGLSASSSPTGSVLELDAPASGGSAMSFHSGLFGDASVDLPESSISPFELVAEAGVSEGFSGFFQATTTTQDIFSTTIVPPASGFVLAILDVQLSAFSGFSGELLTFNFGLNTAPNGTASRSFQVVGDGPANTVLDSIALPRLFAIDGQQAGQPFTVYVTASTATAFSDFNAASLKLVYLPTSYEPVEPAQANKPDVSDEIDTLRERLRELEARLDALE